jgi:NAD-dependent SIR2 family protein deacetylase
MYYYCPHCQTWRADSYVRIDPRTRIPQCTYCEEFVNSRLSDGAYKALLKEHALQVPPPGELE